MVERVFGTVDGAEVILEHAQGDVWQVPVPLDKDGEYVVEIIAENGAGNRTYMAKLLFCVDSSMLCVRIIPLPYYASIMEDVYAASILPGTFSCEVIEPCCRRGG